VGNKMFLKILILDFILIIWIKKLLWVRLGDGMVVFESGIWSGGEFGFSGKST